MQIKLKNKLILIYKISIILLNILVYFYILGILLFFLSWDDLASYLNKIIFLFLTIFFILSFLFIYKFWDKSKILFSIPIIGSILGLILVKLYIYIG